MKLEMTQSLLPLFILVVIAVSGSSVSAQVEPGADDSKQIEFFETKVRPLLVNRCFECHSGTAPKLSAGLRLVSRAAVTNAVQSRTESM